MSLIPEKTMQTIRKRGAQLADEGYRVIDECDGVITISTGAKTHRIIPEEKHCDCKLGQLYGWCSHLEGLPTLMERMKATMGDLALRTGDRSIPILRTETAEPQMSLAETLELAKTLAASGYFMDAKEASQACAKILAGRELGIPPIASMTGIYLVKGRITLSAALIAGIIKRSGRYDYRVEEHTDTVCRVEFFERGQSLGISEFSMQNAQKAGLCGQGSMYDKYPKNMLYSRAISNGARWFTPDVFNGPVYTPDEMGQAVDGATGEVIDVPVSPVRSIAPVNGVTAAAPAATTTTAASAASNPAKMNAKDAGLAFKTHCQFHGYTGDPVVLLTELLGTAPETGKMGKACMKALEIPEGAWKAAVDRLQPPAEPAVMGEEDNGEGDPFGDD